MDMKLSGIENHYSSIVPTLYTIHCGFYRSQYTQNWMCELCTFSQTQSHLRILKSIYTKKIATYNNIHIIQTAWRVATF